MATSPSFSLYIDIYRIPLVNLIMASEALCRIPNLTPNDARFQTFGVSVEKFGTQLYARISQIGFRRPPVTLSLAFDNLLRLSGEAKVLFLQNSTSEATMAQILGIQTVVESPRIFSDPNYIVLGEEVVTNAIIDIYKKVYEFRAEFPDPFPGLPVMTEALNRFAYFTVAYSRRAAQVLQRNSTAQEIANLAVLATAQVDAVNHIAYLITLGAYNLTAQQPQVLQDLWRITTFNDTQQTKRSTSEFS